jgi:CPA2 family monovalent cation:H+ antiporter-2
MSTDLNRLKSHVVLVGYAAVSRRIGAALAANSIPFVVAEQNREIVERLRESDIAAVCGDATEPAVLVQAHIHRAHMVVIGTPDTAHARRIIEIARTVNPRIEAVVRSDSEEAAEMLEKENGTKVFLGEREVAQAMIRHVIARHAMHESAQHTD